MYRIYHFSSNTYLPGLWTSFRTASDIRDGRVGVTGEHWYDYVVRYTTIGAPRW